MISAGATRKRALVLLLLALLGTLLISASLSSLQLQAGLPFPGSQNETNGSEYQKDFYQFEPVFGPAPPDFLKILPLLLFSVCVYLMFRQRGVRRVVFGVLALCLFIWFIAIVFNWLIAVVFGGKQTMGAVSIPPQETPSYAFQVEPIGDAPAAFVWLVILGLVVLVVAIGFWLYLTTSKDMPTKDLIKAEASQALKEIREGSELSNVVIRCYMQMVDTLKTEGGIEREDTVTTQEFEKVLISYGFPERAVTCLTTLFEKVRYGNKVIDSKDELAAVDCLTAIRGSLDERGDWTC